MGRGNDENSRCLTNTETAYPSRTPEWVRVEDLF